MALGGYVAEHERFVDPVKAKWQLQATTMKRLGTVMRRPSPLCDSHNVYYVK